jgi:hypothetical protein
MTTTPATRTAPEIPARVGVIVLGLVIVTVVVCWLIPPASTGDETGVVMDLPDTIGSLEGVKGEISQAELAILPPDTEFARKTYAPFIVPNDDSINRILCSIVLSGREKRSIHRPERCLPGQGWTVIDSRVIDVPLASGHPLKVTALHLRRPVLNGTRMLESWYLYWYVGRKVSTPYSAVRVLLTNWDLIVHRTNQRWAYVIVSKPITAGFETSGLNSAQTLQQLKDFIRVSVPYFVKSEMPADGTATADAKSP